MLTDNIRQRLVAELDDDQREVRNRAALELGKAADPRTAEPLVARLWQEEDFFVRETLTWAVVRLAEDATPHLLTGLAHPSWLARFQAVHALSKLGRFEHAAALIPLIADRDDRVAARAYWAAAKTGNPSVLPALVAQLGRGDAEHQTALGDAFAVLGAAAVPALTEALACADARVREHAADVLGELGH